MTNPFGHNGFVPRSSLEAIKGILQRAKDEVDELSRHEHEWRMHIPVHEKTDSDVIIGNALDHMGYLVFAYELLAQDMLKALKLLDAEGVWTGMDDVLHDRIQQLVNDRDGYKKLYEESKGELDALHDKYAHEGGTPQVMTQNILAEWLKALSVPMAFDIYHAGANVFYVGFSRTLYPDDIRQIEALGFTVVYANSTLRNRYMLKWNPAKDDER